MESSAMIVDRDLSISFFFSILRAMSQTQEPASQADNAGVPSNESPNDVVNIIIVDRTGAEVELSVLLLEDESRNQITRTCVTKLGYSASSTPIELRWRPSPPLTRQKSSKKSKTSDFDIVDEQIDGKYDISLGGPASQTVPSVRRGSFPITKKRRTNGWRPFPR